MLWIRSHLSFANAISMIALFVALGGTSYALTALPKNSVGAKQIKKNAVRASEIRRGAVRSSEVRDGSLLSKDFKAGQLPKGDKGDQGIQGVQGVPGPITGLLPSGVTLRGDYALRVSNSIAGQRVQTAFSFGLQLENPPIPHYIQDGAATPVGCSGNKNNPGADPGHLCVFEFVRTNITSLSQDIFDVTGTAGTADRWGAGIGANATAGTAGAPTDTRIRGSWAVTAP